MVVEPAQVMIRLMDNVFGHPAQGVRGILTIDSTNVVQSISDLNGVMVFNAAEGNIKKGANLKL